MADASSSSPAAAAATTLASNPQPDPAPTSTPQPPTPPPPNPNPTLVSPQPPPPAIPHFVPPPISCPAPSYRPVPQFSPLPNYPNAGVGVQPPGVNPMLSGAPPPAVSVPAPAPVLPYQVQPGQPPRPPYLPMPNGYVPPPQGTMPPPGIPRYPSPYPGLVRPLYPPRPPGAPLLPSVSRPLVPVRPIVTPVLRPPVPSVTPAEKPQTTVFVGKIAPTVENDFILSVLQLCGPVKTWTPAKDSNGNPKGFGFCEFESAEGVLRALRLLSKFAIDGQELLLNVNQATREYLEQYVEKKTENMKKDKEVQTTEDAKEDGTSLGVEKNEPTKSSLESNNGSDKGNQENQDPNFGIVTDEDKESDREALEKLTSMIEERLKTNPLPPPPPQLPANANSLSEMPAKSREGESALDAMRNDAAKDKIDDETTSDNKTASEQDKPQTSSPDKSSKHDRRSRDRDRERDIQREKEREYEREAERERIRKEREHRRNEVEYEKRLKDWEYREREKEKQREIERKEEKERARKRRKEILHDEEDEDDDSRRRWHRSVVEERRRRRLREKEDDLADKLKEEEEIAEAKRRAEEEEIKLQQQLRAAPRLAYADVVNGSEKRVFPDEARVEIKERAVDSDGGSTKRNDSGNVVLQNGPSKESAMAPVTETDARQTGHAPIKKLGFGLVGTGKRAAVPSVFHEDDDDDAHKVKKMRPLVPIDYSTEELQAIQPSGSQPPNLIAAAEFAKRISNSTARDEKPDAEKDRSKRSHDRSSQRDRDRHDDDSSRTREDWDREHGLDKGKTPDKQKILDAKQLIDMIPKTKDELFSYEINWAVYDKHELHERMRPWISKKIVEFLGEEEKTLVDYIVSSTREHVKASQMLEMLQVILDDEAEMFVLKMWRMLIFEIKKVETGLSLRSRA